MQQAFTQPSPLSLTGNLAENWRKWEQRFQVYLEASELTDKSEARKIAVFLHCVGEDGLEVYNTLKITYADPADKALSDVLAAFKKYCEPRKNTVYERHQFWKHMYNADAGIDKFVTELKSRARQCEFGDSEDLMIRDKIVFSVPDTSLREKLLSIPDLALTKAIDLCRAKEVACAQAKAMSPVSVTEHVDAIGSRDTPKQQKRADTNRTRVKDQVQSCGRCGRQHKPRSCPAYNAHCNACGKKNHFSAVCKSSKVVAPLDTDTDSECDEASTAVDTLFIDTVAHKKRNSDTGWFTNLHIGNKVVSFKLDSGAEANILPKSVLSTLSVPVNIQKTDTVLVAYGGARIKPIGKIRLRVQTQHKQTSLDFFVTTASSTALLGRKACVQLDLIRKVEALAPAAPASKKELLARYASVFEGLGEFPGQHHIYTDPSVPPVIHGCRKIPYAVHDRLKTTLDGLESKGVISKVTKPTPWVSSLCITEKKNGSLRVCLDPRDLNRAILRQHFSIPTAEDIQRRLAGKKIFSILDERDGYWQIKLDDESADLCTFNTPWGRYRFHRLPFGIKSASEVFQQVNYESFGDIDGVFIVADDMIIAAENKTEHDRILQKVMDRAIRLNVKFNKDKVQYMVKEVKYLGHIISAEGVKPDDSKVTAIQHMPPPTDRKGLQRLLGMTRYLAQYIPNEAALTAPLRLLLRKDVDWQWHPEQEAALEALKTAISTAPLLRFYDPKMPVEIQADASKDGLGACLMQNKQPIAYASRALSPAEQNYAQIEKELLAVVFSLKKFHQYVYGVPVKIQSDHKPLEAILSKPIGKAPARLQRMLLQIQRYDISLVYTPGKELLIADTLSRAHPHSVSNEHDLGDERVVYATDFEPLQGNIMHLIKTTTATDAEMQRLMAMHRSGWPKHKKSAPQQVKSYWHVRHRLSVNEGLLLMDDRVIVPRPLRAETLKRLHTAHQGIQRSLAHARATMYWPGWSEAVRRLVESCIPCQEQLPANHKEPLLPHPVPDRPWERIAADLFHLNGKPFLLIVDYFSKYPEVLQLTDMTAQSVIQKFKAVLARHGIPDILIADHVPFASSEMAQFAADWGFRIIHSSPHFPQSNGMAERTIRTVKSVLKSAAKSGVDPHLALLHLRNTPVTGLQYSPAQLLMCRMLKSTLPVTKAALMPSMPVAVAAALRRRQCQQKAVYDKSAAPLRPFKEGERVYMRINDKWIPATVVNARKEPRAYDVVTSSGARYRRNRRHLRRDRARAPHRHRDDSSIHDDEDGDSDISGTEAHPNEGLAEDPQAPPPEAVPPPEAAEPASCTRAGRHIQLPGHLRDYVLS